MVLLFAGEALNVASNWLLSRYVDTSDEEQRSLEGDRSFFVWIGVSCEAVGVLFIRAMLFMTNLVRSADAMHSQITKRLVRAPLAFFESNPTGRILNRFGKDMHVIDE